MRFPSVLPRPLTSALRRRAREFRRGVRHEPGAAAGHAAATKGKPRVALVMKSLANEFFVTMADGAKAHQAASGGAYTLVVNGIRNESDLSQQVALVEQMMAQGVDAIVIAPADSRALVPVLAKAQRQKIVVVNIDNKLDEPTLQQAGIDVPFVGPDNRAGARAVGLALAPKLARGSKVAILEGIPTAFNAQQRRLGFEDAMREAGMTVVSVQSAHWEQDEANTIAAALLREHPDLAAILASNDNMALGAAAAVRQASRVGDRRRRRLRSHRRRPAAPEGRADRRHRRPARRQARRLRHRVRARHPERRDDAAGSPDAGRRDRGAEMSVLRLRGLGKRYAAPVLADVDLDLAAGEVHALMGANGAGKSTLSKIVSGLVAADAGTMHLAGEPYRPRTRREAQRAGVQIVLQEPNLIPTLSVAENLFLADLPRRAGFVAAAVLRAQATSALQAVGLGRPRSGPAGRPARRRPAAARRAGGGARPSRAAC